MKKQRSCEAIINEMLKLERQINSNTDTATLTALRGDYRKCSEELSEYYNDEPKEVNHA